MGEGVGQAPAQKRRSAGGAWAEGTSSKHKITVKTEQTSTAACRSVDSKPETEEPSMEIYIALRIAAIAVIW